MKSKVLSFTLAFFMLTRSCLGQDAQLEPLFGLWIFTPAESETSYYYVLMYYSPEKTAVIGENEGIEGDGTSRKVWARYNSDISKYRLIDKVSSAETGIWEFALSGTKATGTWYKQASGSQVESEFEGTLMGLRALGPMARIP